MYDCVRACVRAYVLKCVRVHVFVCVHMHISNEKFDGYIRKYKVDILFSAH